MLTYVTESDTVKINTRHIFMGYVVYGNVVNAQFLRPDEGIGTTYTFGKEGCMIRLKQLQKCNLPHDHIARALAEWPKTAPAPELDLFPACKRVTA